MKLAKKIIFCTPDLRDQVGLGHLSRQANFVNLLRSNGRDAYLVIPDRCSDNQDLYIWLLSKISSKYFQKYSVVHDFLAQNIVPISVVIDSYDFEHTASEIGFNTNHRPLIVFDDLAYERNFPPHISPIIPNICSQKQQRLISGLKKKGYPRCKFGHKYVLIEPVFQLTNVERKQLYQNRDERLRSIINGQRKLKLIISFGGSNEILWIKNYLSLCEDFIGYLKQQFKGIEIYALGAAAISICSKLKLHSINVGLISAKHLRQIYCKSDIYLGSVGYSMWERASFLLPSFVIPIAKNQFDYVETGVELEIHKLLAEDMGDKFIVDYRRMLSSTFQLKTCSDGYLSIGSLAQ